MTYEQIVAAALRLSKEQRADLADLLWLTVDRPQDVAETWLVEAEKRVDQFDRQQDSCCLADEMLAELRAKYK
ncbi:MAG: hypothetical protein CVU31_05470 [Betaproteobacteria bacterium HGW-Betaproteobacteria-4]|jgi:hypothetical protein|nr:MAG: hypothetical protein CVU31_05470 [Betaproteobacteria bacterium HGW-Betaproteobacteria-4]